ncbi:acetyltransferase, GNAT family protein [Trichomonas vaginalis G3]|uniref:Acetyltransferase, GNAT family protein n=1 Tax=Trichomonas vaginalis (strain ATCC PRA-98 / G3) TaxID=412133 RepID=A2EQ31_TRIV3|nr:histone acetyltransferase protein [Trichomonas vaginalis G3]EAY05206.1 acetyltransferase, GNAT family protein [Trichomonas vaginalis G3]KAI5542627.1 histone acetyltransferase protein [Trichomonas vaginalis G3]|eukprot:XP_001317429.1 acetyltransferase, GNAT family protein [Trichomonas vaginalis G3]
MEESAPIWLHRPPITSNLRTHPGIRHISRLHTKPAPMKHVDERYKDAQLRIVRNFLGAHPQTLILLNESKNLFSKQLPNMGGEYISRLVFDIHSETVMLLSNGIVTGSISSRLFPIEEFVEIVFLAVQSQDQARGYGRLVMNYLKQAMMVYKFYDFLACADNEAVTFFKKLGFNDRAIMMDPSRWVRRIKDYDGVTLVHCKLHKEIDYMNFAKTIQLQIDFVENIIGKHIINTPKALENPFVNHTFAPTKVSMPLPKIMKLIHNNVPQTEYDKNKIVDYREKMSKLRKTFISIIDKFIANPKFMLFERPVTEDIAPKYFELIQKPMDFITIKRRLERFPDYYKRPEQLYSDFQLIADNCKAFNPPGSQYIALSNSLMSTVKAIFGQEFPDHAV